MEILHFSHQHKLSFVEVGKEIDPVRCHGCCMFFHGPAYTCKICLGFFIHKSCVELLREIQNHAFHPHHQLKLYPVDSFVCDGCEELWTSLVYRCGTCMFNLDIKCATLDQELATSMVPKGKEIKIMINHFGHNHPLTRCIPYRFPKIVERRAELPCMACKKDTRGKLTYACQSCMFILHESCANNIPEQLKSLFHPEHHLLALPLGWDDTVKCFGCGVRVYGISFSCRECNLHFHVSCAMYQTRHMKHDCHVHPLLLLGKSNIMSEKVGYVACYECRQSIKESFLSCKNCGFDIHLECVPLPSIVKHVRHLHFLKVVNSAVEDDSGEYYCDMCETERNSEHPLYGCEECKFTAHIDCVISQVEPPESISSDLVPRPKKNMADEGDQITGKGRRIKHRKTESSMLKEIEDEIKDLFKLEENLLKILGLLNQKREKMLKAQRKKYDHMYST